MTSCDNCAPFLLERPNAKLRNFPRMQSPVSPKLCETCGAVLDLEAPSGFCPACLLTAALETDVSDSPNAGVRFSDFEILEEIARGGMGIVYRARQRVPVRVVALKMILPAHIDSAEAIARFRDEAQAAASLDHEHILPIYGVGEKDGAPFYSMKFAEGGNLSARLRDFSETPRKCAALVAALARAVEHAHQHGILHRDLKPGNVLFDAAGKPFVSDFGLAKWLEREADLTQTLAILGTPYYMAPEQAAGSHSLTAATDIYSLGAILFHLLTGHPPFRGENAMEVLRNAAEHPTPRPRRVNRNIPADLETICLKCLEKNPNTRYRSAAALAEDLDRYASGRMIAARRAGSAIRIQRWAKRNPIIAGLSAVAALLLVSLLMVLSNRGSAIETRRSIAVLPFESFGDEKENAYFADGVQDQVLTDLTKVADLKVISRRSVARYRGTKQTVREIGQALGVAYVLEGSLRKVAGRIHVNAQLIDTRTEAETWAEKYDRDIADVFQIQDDISKAIVTQIRSALSPREKAAIEEKPTQDQEAYDLYLRARVLVNQFGTAVHLAEENATKTVTLLEAAIARDPQFALAYCLLGETQLDLHGFGYGLNKAALVKAKQAIDAALRISPKSAEAHLILARYYLDGVEDVPAAEKELAIAAVGLPGRVDIFKLRADIQERRGEWKKALLDREKATDLDPETWTTRANLIDICISLRRYADAERMVDRVIAITPHQTTGPFWIEKAAIALARGDAKAAIAAFDSSPSRNSGLYVLNLKIADVLVDERNYTRAEEILSSAEEVAKAHNVLPKSGLIPFYRGENLVHLGRIAHFRGEEEKARGYFEAARKVFEGWSAVHPEVGTNLAYIAQIDAALGRKEDAIREGRRAVEMDRERDARFVQYDEILLAITYMWTGDRDAALQQLAEAAKFPSGDPWSSLAAGDLKLNPIWDDLRNDPRFGQLIAQAAEPVKLD
jgi:serine/threonine protein kinase/Tfp pilus assembly protein PilF